MLILLNKPFGVLCQFSPQPERLTLADCVPVPDVYPAGRLDADSEGLLLLTDDGKLQHAIAHPDRKEAKTYLVQVEGVADAAALAATLLVASTSAFAAPAPVHHAKGAHATKAHTAQHKHVVTHAAKHTPHAVKHNLQVKHHAKAHKRQHAA
jgi:16S rRNA U516 pseudouridylate synthase RsuA-like enzyme